MVGPTPRTPVRQGRSILERLDILESRGGVPSRLINSGRGTTDDRDIYFTVPATDAQRVDLANRRPTWFNTDLGWEEGYFASAGMLGLTAPGLIFANRSGWYPTGKGPRIQLFPSGVQSMTTGNIFTTWQAPGVGMSSRVGGAAWLTFSSGVVLPKKCGRYRSVNNLNVSAGGGSGVLALGLYSAGGTITAAVAQDRVTLEASQPTTFHLSVSDIPLDVDESLRIYASSVGSAGFGNGAHATLPNSGGLYSLEYIGPALVSN